ncbi:MAG TPA: CheR family methyltransferase, partial [Burkholderiaceae bacterium]
MSATTPAAAEEQFAQALRAESPGATGSPLPVVGLGGSAGAIPALEAFLAGVAAPSGAAYVVVLHLSPSHESSLAELLQKRTTLRVVQVREPMAVEPDTVYVIPPGHALAMVDGRLDLHELPTGEPGRVAVDLFFRTLAETHGPHAIAVVLSGHDADGAIGIKRIKERGGLAIAQDPADAAHAAMPRAAIATGLVDWVLPAAEMPARVARFLAFESRVHLPPAEAADDAGAAPEPSMGEEDLRDVLGLLRTRTGRDFSRYKRATVLRRIGRRMQVNGVQELGDYLACLRTRPAEAEALLQDLLISVTNFFRDAECFEALARQIPALFQDKAAHGSVRVWVPACATGEEAYSIAMLLAEHARTLEAPPAVQVFATDLDEAAIRVAREAIYPATIAADVSDERLRRFFTREHRGYRVRRELRELVLFATHDLLKDAPFSRLDLVSCRNLLIYLDREAQRRVLEIAHFAMVPTGRLFLGASETVEEHSPLFYTIDKTHRLFAPRTLLRPLPPSPAGHEAISRVLEMHDLARGGPVVPGLAFASSLAVEPRPTAQAVTTAADGRPVSWAEMHFRMLEMLAPPSVVVDAGHEILHLSPNAGRFLQYTGGEPSRSLLRAIHPALRIELRGALYQAQQHGMRVEVAALPIDIAGRPLAVRMAVTPMGEVSPGLLLVTLEVLRDGQAAAPATAAGMDGDPLSQLLDRELERLKSHLRDTVEQYEASTEELKASNEELQAMNEELRSATEELETSREELQSINEELTTVNHELKAKVDELGHANSDMQNLMDATAIATVFLDRGLRITRYTPSAVALFNLIPTDVGRPLSDLTNRLNYPQLEEDARAVLKGLVPIEREVDDARRHWFLARTLPYRIGDDRIAGVVLTLVDVTERKRSQEALRASEERLRLVIDNATEYAIFSTDREHRIVSWSSGAQRLLGWTEAEVLGRPYDLIFSEEERARGVPRREAEIALAEGRASDERTLLRKNGERFWASGAMMPMRDDRGEVVGFVKIVRDQSAERQVSDALATSRAELVAALAQNQHARGQLQEADVAKDRFLAVLSHELRNPLASIASATQVLRDPGRLEPVDQERARAILHSQVQAMRALLDDLQDVSRLRFGQVALQRRELPLSEVVDAALDTARPAIEQRRHALEVVLPPGPLVVDVDPARMAQVLSNLLVNAAKYTDEGGHVALRARAEGGRCVIEVSDDGRGLDEAARRSMFEMFWRADERDPAGAQGLGIGLAVVRSLVQMHGGTVSADSAGPGRGSTFVVSLPL